MVEKIIIYAHSQEELDSVVVNVIGSVFENINRSITLYAHNLGRFDGIEILKGIKSIMK